VLKCFLFLATALLLLVTSIPAQARSSRGHGFVFYTIGTFTHSSRLFHISASEWQMKWQFNCHGSRDNFIVDVLDQSGNDQGTGVNELSTGGHGTEYMHQGGTFYLTINSGCAWAIHVYAAHGSWGPNGGNKIVDREAGSGQHQSRLFRVPSEWQMRWSFDCRSFGSSGNFIVDVASQKGFTTIPGVNELATSDSGTEYMHQGGTFYLRVNSECSWKIAITH